MKSFAIIGGDLRQTTLASSLQEDGYQVVIYGFDKDMDYKCFNMAENLDYALSRDVVVLPVPVSCDGRKINAPFSNHDIPVDDIISGVTPDSIVLGGRVSDYMMKQLEHKEVRCIDYLEREELAIKNAIPTAEGAVQIAMEETPTTIWGSKCLVIGYGRIGRTLSSMLKGLGAEVCVSARKYSDLAWIEACGCKSMKTAGIKKDIGKFDIIFNTVPSMVINKATLTRISPGALVIDLASKPGGVDFEAAKDIGVNVIWALSLPGKAAPVTSGKIIKDTALNILSEMGV